MLFGLPRNGAALDAFADAVMRREQARPGSVAQALDRWAAQGKFGEQVRAVRDGLLTLVSDAGERSPGGSPSMQLAAGAEEDDIRRVGPDGRELTLNEGARQELYNASRGELARVDPKNPILTRETVHAPGYVPDSSGGQGGRARGGARPRRRADARERTRDVGAGPRRAARTEAGGAERGDAALRRIGTGRQCRRRGMGWWAVSQAAHPKRSHGAQTGFSKMKSGSRSSPGTLLLPQVTVSSGSRRCARRTTSLLAKNPDMRLGSNIADVVAPISSNPEQVRKAVSDKVSGRQAYHVVLNLGRTGVTREQIEALLQRKPITGLRELFIIEKNGAIVRVLPEPEQIVPALQAR